MRQSLFKNKAFWSISAPLAIILSLVWLSKSLYYSQNAEPLSLAITLDLCITVPVVYFLLIRRTAIPKISVAPVFLLCTYVGNYILPAGNQNYLEWFQLLVLPMVELGVVSYIAWKVYRLISLSKKTKNSTDKLLLLRQSNQEVFGQSRVSNFLAYEIAVFYYAIFIGKKTVTPAQNELTHYHKGGAGLIYAVMAFLLIAETFAVHIAVAQWNNVVAWVLSIGSLYLLWIILGHYSALRKRHSYIDEENIHLRSGLGGDATIPFEQIVSINITRRTPKDSVPFEKLGFLGGLESHNVLIETKSPITVTRIYGIKKTTTTLLFHVDEPEQLMALLKEKGGIE